MFRLLGFLGGRGTQVLFAGVFLGLLLPDLAALLRPLLAPAVACLLLLALLRVDWEAMGEIARRPLRLSLALLWMMGLSPLLTWLTIQPLSLPLSLQHAIVLMACAPPILGATAVAILLGLDGALAVVVGMVCTAVTPLTVPPLALHLLGVELDIGLVEFMLRLGAIISLSFFGAYFVRRIAGTGRIRGAARQIDGLVVLVMLVFAVGIMDGATDVILETPEKALFWILAAFIANPALQLAGSILFSPLGLRRALTIGLLSGNCNMGLLLASLPRDADPDVQLFFALAQLPMYMLPALVLPLYRRLLAAGAAPEGPKDTPSS